MPRVGLPEWLARLAAGDSREGSGVTTPTDIGFVEAGWIDCLVESFGYAGLSCMQQTTRKLYRCPSCAALVEGPFAARHAEWHGRQQ